MNKDQLKLYIINYLQNEQPILDGSNNFLDTIPAEINRINVINNTKNNNLNTFDSIDSEVEYNIDKHGL
ncbi:MAG: hypothetical protein Ta2E_02080 [Mycoplasmoidaceae bacterium]|nr:MAG: hypothetical protein Ta2E_02080 [Mycoplasmoidaceae bacterium]